MPGTLSRGRCCNKIARNAEIWTKTEQVFYKKSFPTWRFMNVQMKVWWTFRRKNLQSSFTKIIRERRRWFFKGFKNILTFPSFANDFERSFEFVRERDFRNKSVMNVHERCTNELKVHEGPWTILTNKNVGNFWYDDQNCTWISFGPLNADFC